MAAKTATLQQIAQVFGKAIVRTSSKAGVAATVTSEAIDVARVLSKKSFGFDFVTLIITILIVYAAAWFIDIYMKAKLFFDDPAVQSSIIAGLFGLAGLLFNFFLPKETNPQKLTDNKFINDLFSDAGIKGFRYWDVVNLLVMLIIVATYFRLRSDSMDREGKPKIQPATTALFIILFLAVSLIEVPSLVKRLKMTTFGIQAMGV